jgi:hypothetical protein
MMRRLLGLVALTAFLVAGSAAKPISTGTIGAPVGDVRLGGEVTFPYSFDGKGNQQPRIEVDCYQDGELVYAAAARAWEPVVLGGGWSLWVERGGPASCVAILYWWDFKPSQVFNEVARIEFEASDGPSG